MDQKKSWVPKLLTNTKASSGMLYLNNHITGVIVTNGNLENDREHLIYTNSDQYKQDSNKSITQMCDILLHVKKKLGNLPRKLLVQTDNCKKDLKNQYLLRDILR